MFYRGVCVLFMLSICFSALWAGELLPEHVAVVYNGKSKLSKEVALEYMKTRGIPVANLVELDCPPVNEIRRVQYDDFIKVPLLRRAIKDGWWQGGSLALSLERKIYSIVLMPDIPMKIRHETPVPPRGKPLNQMATDRAAVDSELAMLAHTGYNLNGALRNEYYNKEEAFCDGRYPIFLVCRIDGLSKETCLRMVRDPAEVEKRGLWGWAVVDRGGPYKQGDQWMDAAFEVFRKAGIPVYKDDWDRTLPAMFPLSNDTALYCGWYARNANGPFADAGFRFRPGAVAMHLHSYSAEHFKTPGRGWSSALLEHGAAATIGNVNEPFLGMTHRFDILTDRLLKGYTLAEAAWMSIPVTSWQGVVFGDPLYRPFSKMKSMDVEPNALDRYFQGWWAGRLQYEDNWQSRAERMLEAARKAKNSFIYEALALEYLYGKDYAAAERMLTAALDCASDDRTRSRLRLELTLVARARGGKNAYLAESQKQRALMGTSRFLPALNEWDKRMVPPPPKPVKK